MAIFTITSGEADDLAVVKVTPVIEDCTTIYEYIVTTNVGDSIDLTLTGNHYEAKYFNGAGSEISFSDTSTLTYDGYLKVRFLLLNSGTGGVFSNCTINITNTTEAVFYENFVERQNDTANCYDQTTVPINTSDLVNDGADSTSTYVETDELVGVYLPLAGGTMSGTIDFNDNDLSNINNIEWQSDVSANTVNAIMTSGTLWSLAPSGSGKTFAYDFGTNTWLYDGSEIAKFSDIVNTTDADLIVFDPYLTITSADVQAAIEELKDEVDLLGSATVDSVITNGSTNAVENNAVFDALVLKGGLADINIWSGTTNTFDNTLIINDAVSGIELFSVGSDNYIDINGGTLNFRTNTHSEAFSLNTAGNFAGTSGTTIYAPIITTDYEVYSAGWAGNTEVPTKQAVYEKIETLVSATGDVTKVGTPVDDQVGVWTGDGTIEGTTGLTYDGTDLDITGNIVISGTVDGIDIATDVAANTAKVTFANLTGDVTSVGAATTIAAGAVDIPMLSASGTADATTFLRGDNTWGTPAGGGDVSKVGTPANNEVGIWTGDGTIEGDSNFVYDGSTVTVIGEVTTTNGYIHAKRSGGTGDTHIAGFGNSSTAGEYIFGGHSTGTTTSLDSYATISKTKFEYYDGTTANEIWHSGNDGAGSGLDADLVGGWSTTSSGNRWGVRTRIESSGAIEIGKYIDFHNTDGSASDHDGRLTLNSANDWTFNGAVNVDDDAYAIGWNGNTEVPTKNAVYDKIESITISDNLDTGITGVLEGSTSGTYTVTLQNNTIYQVGDLVFFNINLTNVSGSSPVGELQFDLSGEAGWPDMTDAVSVFPVMMSGSDVNFYSIVAIRTTADTFRFRIQTALDGSNNTALSNVNFTAGNINFSGTYRTA